MSSRHGAFAIDADPGGTGRWGWTEGFIRPTAAADAALRACRGPANARGCAVALRFQDACAAYASDARGDLSIYGGAWGPGIADMRDKALANCRIRGGAKGDCVVRVAGCSVSDSLPTTRSGNVWALPAALLVTGRRFRECATCPELAVVPGGVFVMGAPMGEEGRYADEGPRRRVTIRSSFAVGVAEVTFAQWDACAAAGGCGSYLPADEGWGRDRRPVINVNRKDAEAYASWLSEKTRAKYRLPSEAEWEYLARAGTETPFHTGATIAPTLANYDGTKVYGDGVGGAFRGHTLAVGRFRANAFGLHDMHGNVWEWVRDCWNASYDSAPNDGDAWRQGDCDKRVQRGGSWSNAPKDVRSAVRNWRAAGHRGANSGFRVVREVQPEGRDDTP